MRALLNLHVRIGLEDIGGDELYAMMIIEEEQNRFDKEKSEGSDG